MIIEHRLFRSQTKISVLENKVIYICKHTTKLWTIFQVCVDFNWAP